MRIKDKIEEIEGYVHELGKIIPPNFEDYKEIKTKAACERYFEKIIGAIIDLAFLVIKELSLKIPEEDKGAFDVLFENKIISKELSTRLKEAKGMRNLLSHRYGYVDDEIVFESITGEIEKDSREFINEIKKLNLGKS